jgi:hypothetical protein
VRKRRTTAEADAQVTKAVVMERAQGPLSAACFEDMAMRCEALSEQHLKQYKKHAGFDSDVTESIDSKSSWCQEGVAQAPSLLPGWNRGSNRALPPTGRPLNSKTAQ